MSLNGVSSTVFPNTLNGLDSLDLTSLTINGQQLATLFVPYTGALSNVDLNAKSLTGVNGITCAAVTASGLVQSQNVTATALTTTNTLKVNSVPAGTTAKYLATNATGEVIEANITTVYVPYTGATSHVNLNAKNLSNVLTYSGTNVQVTSTETTSLLATGTTQLYTLRITSVPAGTQTSILAIDSSGNVIQGTASSSQLNLTAAVSSTVYYFPFIPSTSAGNQTVYVDTTVGSPSYLPSTQTLTVQNLAGNAATATKLYTTQTAVSSNYYFSFVPTNTAGNQDHYVAYPGTFGQDSYYSTGATLGDPGTFYFQRVNVAAAMQLPQDTTFPLISPGTAAFSLGIDSSNRIMKFTPGAPTVTATTANTGYYLAMCASNASGAQPLYVDGNGYITYNPSTYSLGVPNLTVSIGANIAAAVLTGTPTAPTAAPGTNTTQIATCAFVTTAIGSVSGYLPLTGGTMSGSITYANTVATPITLSSANLTAYTYSIRDSFWTLPMLEFTTKTLSTFGSVSFGVPIVITNTSATNLMSLPYNAATAYSKSISNTGGDLFITFTGRTSSSSGTVVFGNSVPVAINDTLAVNKTVGLYGVNGVSNDGVALWVTSGATACGSIVLTDTYGTTMGTATPTTSFGRYFAVGGQVFQDFYGGFEWRGTNTLGSTTWSSVATVAKLRVAQMGYRFGSMFDFASAGGWDDSNSLFITTGGFGGNSSGVGIGYNTTIDSGLLVAIAPNVAWKPMTYKANQHDFYVAGNTPMGGFNPFGIYSNNAGYMTNSVGAASIGLSGVGSGDLVFQANSSQVMRWFTGTSQRLVLDSAGGLCFGTSGIGLQTITGSPYGNVSTYGTGVNTWMGYDINRRWCLMGLWNNAEAGFHDNTYSWIWRTTANNFIVDRPSVIYTNVPQQTYYPNQVLVGNNGGNLEWGVMYSTYYYGGFTNWGGGVAVSSFYKASSISNIRISGAASYYIPGAGMYYTECQFQNLSTGNSYYMYQYQYTNFTGNHFSFPICFQFGGLPVGSYNVYLRCNAITDGNDHVYILGEIVPF